jgi:class 3 adenylate cyclase
VSRHSRKWTWQFEQPAEALWPLISDTARFNEALKTPKYLVQEIPQPDGSMLRLARTRIGPVELEWEEHPFEWVLNRSFTQTRVFRKGPFRRFGPRFEIADNPSGSLASYEVIVEPANLLGRLLLLGGFMRRTGAMIDPLMRSAGKFASGLAAQVFNYTPPPPAPGIGARIEAITARLESGPHGHGLAERLAQHLLTAQEVDLIRLRPRVLARSWKVPDRHAIELCLAAVREGLMSLRWDLLCPRCRGAKVTTATLDQLPTGAHCPSCNIDYGRDFTRNVELTFQPSASIRALATGEYCLSGPGTTPHVVVQQILAPGEARDIEAQLAPGPYRLRTLEPGGHCDFEHGGDGFPELIAEDEAMRIGPRQPDGIIRCSNRRNRRTTFVIESRRWAEDALTAYQVTLLQGFRDLFSDQVLRPGDEVGIEQITLLFTDLKGSTALYERIGDAGAYHLVRQHFAFLTEVVRRADGAVIKTIGDAVMAAFADPVNAVSAARAIQARVSEFNAAQGEPAISIKLGLHQGPCIAVTLNDRLDYFGSNVNLAARLQGESRGGDIVLSEPLANDPGVAAVIAPLHPERNSAVLRGIARPVSFWRIVDAGVPVARSATAYDRGTGSNNQRGPDA